ncbi:hypothetical protein J0A67_06155 [Algoriphagus aestuariicola]|uniref:Carbohydrate-binding family V/XII n=1 Tax=Algoriphagus aestuariicola TaxID=1852016 RepID=A0ABS3BNN8_9BACT|nr:hypothetical protein [Algoriphagus aestuariicola]MBN7800434.1 hypothetical protein [Algoriphagus aestuariicola]
MDNQNYSTHPFPTPAKRYLGAALTAAVLIFSTSLSPGQNNWPKDVFAKNGAKITVYQPQPETLNGNEILGRSAFSVEEAPNSELIFGVFWYEAMMNTDRDTRALSLESVKITDVKLPGVDDGEKINNLKTLLETEIPLWGIASTIDEINATIDSEQQINASEGLNNDAPEIFYSEEPTLLLLFDGEPKLEQDKDLKMDRVINTPYLILQAEDKKFYLFAGQGWYISSQVKEGYVLTSKLPKSISEVDKQIKDQQTEKPNTKAKAPKKVISSITPAEIIQSDGKADFANIDGTDLLYMSNSEDNIFRYIDDQKYYLLLSGRWYNSTKLEGPWTYLPADNLPAEFAKIPESSPKGGVLASVPGTKASLDAIHDAQVPQTAKVDRAKAKLEVTYDGEPKFEPIEGTKLDLAMNTKTTVLRSGKKYYAVDNGVWFVADNATGPWKVSDERPKDVEDIPANSPAYNVKYVYIYESTPEVVYVGYTPGYMGSYVYGPTVVYGTGYYYNPWYGPYYYPRPVTFGFSMHYNPWTGWSMGFSMSYGFFTFGFYGGGGYWGPGAYRPPYYGGGNNVFINNGDINIDRSNNIYNKRNDVTTRDVQRGDRGNASTRPTAGQRPSNEPGVSTNDRNRTPSARPSTGQQPANRGAMAGAGTRDVYSDRNGNVYNRDANGNWSQRQGNSWQNTTNQPAQMNRDYQNRQRSATQNHGFQQSNRAGNLGGSYHGGAARMGGGRRR